MARGEGDLRTLLTAHGVSEKGARIYIAASHGGPQAASELARVSAMHRVEAYRFIEQLIAQGLLHETGGRPRRFAALPPEELVDRWIEETSSDLARLERDRDAIVRSWQETRDLVGASDGRKFSVLEGQEATDRLLGKQIGVAQRTILMTLNGARLAALMDGGVDRALREAARRGVRIRIVTDIHRAHLAETKHYLTFAEVRHATTPLAHRSLVIDKWGALVYISGEGDAQRDGGGEQIALWSTAPALVELSREYHQRLWAPGVRAENRLVDIESPNMTVLPVVAGREREPFRRMREITALGMQATGTKELRLSVPGIVETIADQLGRQIADEIDARTPAEVGAALVEYYAAHARGKLEVSRQRPLSLRVRDCYACTDGSTEIGRVLCPRILSSVFESRLGGQWEVSRPDPTRHAQRGCLFVVSAA